MRLCYAVIALASLQAGCAGAGRPVPDAAPRAGVVATAEKPPPEKPIPDEEPAVTQTVRETLLRVAEGKAGPEQFTERAGAAMFPVQAGELGARLRGYGALGELQLLARKVDGEDRLYRYRARYPQVSVLVDITFNKGGRIGLLQARPE